MATKAPPKVRAPSKKAVAEARDALKKSRLEPELDVLNYKLSMAKALQYYNVQVEPKRKVEFSKAFAKREGLDISGVPDAYLNSTLGAISRLILVEQPVEDSDVVATVNQFKSLASRFPPAKTVAKTQSPATVVKPQEHVENSLTAELEGAIDEIITSDSPVELEAQAFFARFPEKKLIASAVTTMKIRLAQFTEAKTSDDSYVQESWSFLKIRKLNRVIKFLESVITAGASSVAKPAKPPKVRMKKEKPASVLVAKVKYLQKSEDYKLESIKPVEMVDASEVVLFNTKTRKISVCRAPKGQKLLVQGTSLKNLDPITSLTFTLRKPDLQLKEFVKQTKRNVETAMKSIKTTMTEAAGRLNEDILIIAVSK